MIKAAFMLVAASVLGLATLAMAQDPADEDYLAVADDGPWYLQRSTCTLAHNDDATGVTAWFRISMGTDIEFADRRLTDVEEHEDVAMVIAVDDASEESMAQGVTYDDGRKGYRLFGMQELIDRIGAGRRLELRRGRQAVLRLDLAGADVAVSALSACREAELATMEPAMDMDANFTNGQ